MTALAEVTLELALAQACAEQRRAHGAPRDAAGSAIEFWIVGMGKLGARELNVSSDIDLVYVYEDDGQTDGAAAASSAHEYFAQVARGLYALIGDSHRRRLRVPRRPGAAARTATRARRWSSLAMLEEYFQVAGPRVGALRLAEEPRRRAARRRHERPRAGAAPLVTPFVYRRYLDYGVFEGLRQLHRKVRDEAQRRAAGRPERANDVKLSRGGIREIEFIVQLLLVVRGGQFPEIRTRSTLQGAAAAGRAAA